MTALPESKESEPIFDIPEKYSAESTTKRFVDKEQNSITLLLQTCCDEVDKLVFPCKVSIENFSSYAVHVAKQNLFKKGYMVQKGEMHITKSVPNGTDDNQYKYGIMIPCLVIYNLILESLEK